jgi:hypothetical protein
MDAPYGNLLGDAGLYAGLALTPTHLRPGIVTRAATARALAIAGLTVTALLPPAGAAAQQLNLSISPVVVTFPTADPDTAPTLSSPPVTVQYRVRGNGNRPWVLTVLAAGDLISGGSRIPASAVTWSGTPSPPLVTGTMSTTQAQPIATGNGNVNPQQTGTVTFRLTNSWNYDAGTYIQILTFTLSTP